MYIYTHTSSPLWHLAARQYKLCVYVRLQVCVCVCVYARARVYVCVCVCARAHVCERVRFMRLN